MEYKEYYNKQIKREFIEKFGVTGLEKLNVIKSIHLVYKTRKIMNMPYISSFLLRRQCVLESFTNSKWSLVPLYYPKPGRADSKLSRDFSVVYKNHFNGTKIFDFLASLFIFMVWRYKTKNIKYRCYYMMGSKKLTLKLHKINLAPWIPLTMRRLIYVNNLRIHFTVTNELLFKSLLTRLQFNKYIIYITKK